MTTYVTYQCTICRRSKAIEKDDVRAQPDQCVITKGCLGKLYAVGETQERTATPSISGVQDWFPRGQSRTTETASSETPDFTLATSATGSLVMAIIGPESGLPSTFNFPVLQLKIGPVDHQQYTFNASGTIIVGRDVNGKNLRFDQLAIDDNLVTVRLNGVKVFPALTPNTITFATALPSGSVVDVIVSAEPAAEEKLITFTRNKLLIPTLARGSWANIDFVDELTATGTVRRYLYSADDLGNLGAGRIRLKGTADIYFLLADTPYQSVDRYLNFAAKKIDLSSDYNITPSSGLLMASASARSEIFPPLTIPVDAYISTDLYTATATSAIITDTAAVRFSGAKILGPV